MIKKKTLEKISNLFKTSPSLWPMGVAISLTGMVLGTIVHVHLPCISVKLLILFCTLFLGLSLWKWASMLNK